MTRSTEKLIRVALRDGCREHCDALIDELRRLSAENERIWPLAERVLELKVQRDALLEAASRVDRIFRGVMPAEDPAPALDALSAVIKAVKEGN